MLVAEERAPPVAVKDASSFTFRRSWWLCREAVAALTLWPRILTFASFWAPDRGVAAGRPPEGVPAAEVDHSVVPPVTPGLVLARSGDCNW